MLKNFRKLEISWLCRKIICHNKYSLRMKPPYSGSLPILETGKGLSSIKRPSQCGVSRLLSTRQQSCLRAMLQAVNWNPLWSDTVRSPGPLSTRHTLPMYCRSNEKSGMTQLLFQDALLNSYASEIEKCCLVNSIPLGCCWLLIMLLDVLFSSLVPTS